MYGTKIFAWLFLKSHKILLFWIILIFVGATTGHLFLDETEFYSTDNSQPASLAHYK